MIKTYDPDAVNGAADDQGRVSIVIDGGATFSNSTPKEGKINYTGNNKSRRYHE